MNWIVYVLADHLGEPRYVGFTTQGHGKRLAQHRSKARDGSQHVYCWWRKHVRETGLEPSLTVLRSGSDSLAAGHAAEREVIDLLRRADARLTNLTDGGEGTPGHVPTDAHRAKISAAHRGRTHSPEWVEKIAAANRGRIVSDQQRRKMSSTIAGKDRWGPERRISDQEIADIRATYTGVEGERAALVRATGWSITTINRALDESLWDVPGHITGRVIALAVHDRSSPMFNGRAVLTPEDVWQIRFRHASGEPIAAIARAFDVGWSQTARIVRRESWADVA